MIEYIKWIFAPKNINANIFTMISVIMSGIVSWIISAIYFSRGNRNNLRASVLSPVRHLLESTPATWEKYRKLTEYTKDYSMKYLKRKERPVVDELLSAYQEVCCYKYECVCAESLYSYFYYKLKKSGINPTPVPIYIDGEVVNVEAPQDMLYLRDDLERVINKFPPEYDTEKCVDGVTHLFKYYCKEYYTDKKIIFFDDYTLFEVLKKAKNKGEWDDKFERYKRAKEAFLQIK
ncbi:hypothetical protein GPK84_06805 [Blautia wexlerae]|jgi:hypothetical protein|uniref:hypothetical protein n=1 Tax=Blautia wexlerae TaxID=418240 RepID=UPI001C02DEDD|nr:hypothetical protein [Blautia wexlerae]MBT9805659.1 hypothetical protein [Blautia wexlerae]